MILLELFLNFMLLFGGFGGLGGFDATELGGEVNIHTIHGHLPNHLHHGQHGHTLTNPGGHQVFH